MSNESNESNNLPLPFLAEPALFGVGTLLVNASRRFQGLEEAPLLLQFPGAKLTEEWTHWD